MAGRCYQSGTRALSIVSAYSDRFDLMVTAGGPVTRPRPVTGQCHAVFVCRDEKGIEDSYGDFLTRIGNGES